MAVAHWKDGSWSEPEVVPTGPFSFHPATHVLHYGSACFEGLKAHRGADGVVRVFRAERHAERMATSAGILRLPVPPGEMLNQMIHETVAANRDQVPVSPGSLYLRPTLIGTEANIGAAAVPSKEAMLFVLASPVGDYFKGGDRALKIAIEQKQPRSTPTFGMVKSGANYVMALGITMDRRDEYGIDQVLFAPGGDVQETGASNFMLIDAERIVTPKLTESFLHGVTRDSILQLGRDLGYEVQERSLTVSDVVEWASRPDAEAALSGTAAVLAAVGTLVIDGEEIPVGTGAVGTQTTELRAALRDIHLAVAEDRHSWLTET
ncbi:MAG TPA: branched-chain-amino-acid transaminase [Acidimicrobiia bacterium]|nr:branched-chain-amino-acid transaminase [Acidimicrobiia bacterium]